MKNKRKVKSIANIKINKTGTVFSVVILLVLSLGFFKYNNLTNNSENNKQIAKKTNKNIVYPKQYSDSHITENAKVSNPKFKNITFENKTSLLANLISSVKTNNYVPKNQIENGSWLWTPVLYLTPEYRKTILSGAKRNGIKNIYLSIDSYLDIYVLPNSQEKDELQKQFDENISNFIREAKESGISVDAEAGWRNWAEIGNSYKAFAVLSYAIEFNKNHEEKFRGFQYDVEPYLLDDYKENKKRILGNLINLVDETVARLDESDLLLSVVIPEFYDEESGETPEIFYAGKSLYTVEQLLRVLDKREGSSIIVMSYRNFSRGQDGSIDISKEEINTANKYNTKIILAQETGEVEPPYITFYNTKRSYYEKQVNYLIGAFKNDKSFGGTAIHYINAFLEL